MEDWEDEYGESGRVGWGLGVGGRVVNGSEIDWSMI